jgi:hypothetical protein
MPLAIAVFLLSAAALAAEVLLMRVFSIIEWHHFAWMVISLALLGYAAAGTFVAIFRRPLVRRVRATLILFAFLAGTTLLGSVSLIRAVQFNSLEIVWDPRQTVRLFALYLLLSIPFFSIAVFLGTVFTAMRGAVARLYRADLLGAGVGAASVVWVLFAMPVDDVLRCVAATASTAAALVALASRGRTRAGGVALAIAGIAVSIGWPASMLRPATSPYKDLAQALRIPGARIVQESSGPMGFLDAVANDTVPFRQAAGLSLAFAGEIPPQIAIFTDGTANTTVPRVENGSITPAYTDYLTSAAAHSIRSVRGGRALIIGANVPAILAARGHGAQTVDVVERDGRMIRLVREELAMQNAHLDDPRISFHCADPRAFLQRPTNTWRLIETTIESGGPSGEAGLRENYLFTTEGIGLLMRRLEPGGVVSITGPVRMPPNEIMKLILTVAAAAKESGAAARDSLVAVRSWSTATVLFRREPFAPADLDAVARFCDGRSFDLDFPPRSQRQARNVLDRPYLTEAALAAVSGGSALRNFLARYKFDLTPATDSRPFFFDFFRWSALPELLRLRDRGGAPLIAWGYLVLLATLVQALAATVVLVVLPLAIRGGMRRDDRASVPGLWRVILYFAAIGLAFLFVEIAFLQRFTLFLRHPLYAASAILGSFLVCAGIGSGIARRIDPHNLRARAAVLVAIAILATLYALGLRPLFAVLAPASEAMKVIASILAVAPIAVVMGMPFPLGIALFGGLRRSWIPWAWAINGSASVVSAIMAMLLAMTAGVEAVVGCAAVLYIAASLALSNMPALQPVNRLGAHSGPTF